MRAELVVEVAVLHKRELNANGFWIVGRPKSNPYRKLR
jgi:hypothetical protein